MADEKSGYIDWHEGLLVRRQHLQLLQRQVLRWTELARDAGEPFAHGLLEPCAIDLSDGHVSVRRCRAVLPSGRRLDVPGNADVKPCPLPQSSAEPMIVSLGIADQVQPVAQVFHVGEMTVADEHDPEQRAKVRLRRYDARLRLGTANLEADSLPIARILWAGAGELPRLDDSFVPACRCVEAVPALAARLRRVAGALDECQRRLSRRADSFRIEMADTGDLPTLLRLLAVARFRSVARALAAAPRISPFRWFLLLAELLDSVGVVCPEDTRAPAAYDHDHLDESLGRLADQLVPMLQSLPEDRFVTVEFQEDKRLFTARLDVKHFGAAKRWYLGIETAEAPERLRAYVTDPNQFRLSAPSMVHSVGLRGARLSDSESVPAVLPRSDGMAVFRIEPDQLGNAWRLIEQEKALAARWESDPVPARLWLFVLAAEPIV